MINPLVSIVEEDARALIASVDLSNLAGKSILLTGASGLLGTYFLASLREQIRKHGTQLQVTAVVYSTLAAQLNSFLDFEGAHVVRGDLIDPDFVRGLGRFDYIIHAAGYGQPGLFMEDQVKTLKLNTSTTLALFDRLAADGQFLFLSTSEVYSGHPNPPYRETQIGTTNTTHARSCYIEAKRCGEAICNAYRARGVNASSARLALAYGPGTKLSDRRVLNAFVERGLTQGKITLQDMGSAKRTYCYVSDAIEILWNILLSGREPIYNVGGMSRTTIAELAVKVGNYLGVPVEFPTDSQELGGAPQDVYLDMSLVEREFKKDQYLSLDYGLARTIEWQKALYTQALHEKE
jgi:nucleoside-diphosphate-sugar epimerase